MYDHVLDCLCTGHLLDGLPQGGFQSTQEALKLKPELLQHIFYVVSIFSFHFMQISLYENTSHAYVGNFIFIIPSFIEDMIKTTATKKINCLPSLKLTFSYTFALEHQWFEDVICLWGPAHFQELLVQDILHQSRLVVDPIIYKFYKS